MQRIPALEISAAPAASKIMLDAVQKKIGMVPNLFTNYFNHIAGTVIDFPPVITDKIRAAA